MLCSSLIEITTKIGYTRITNIGIIIKRLIIRFRLGIMICDVE